MQSERALIAQYWLVPGMDLSLIYNIKIACFTKELKWKIDLREERFIILLFLAGFFPSQK